MLIASLTKHFSLLFSSGRLHLDQPRPEIVRVVCFSVDATGNRATPDWRPGKHPGHAPVHDVSTELHRHEGHRPPDGARPHPPGEADRSDNRAEDSD